MVRAEFVERVVALFVPDLARSFTIRGISERTGLSYDATYRVVGHLLRAGALEGGKVGASSSIRLARSSARARKLVESVSLARTEALVSSDAVLGGMLEELVRELAGGAQDELHSLVLFGSLAKGTRAEGSDCDLLVLASTFEVGERLERICDGVGKRYGVQISPLVTTPKEFQGMLGSAARTVAHEVAADGLVLYGHERYYGLLFEVPA